MRETILTDILPMTTEYLEACTELYINVFRSEPWNEDWTYDAGYQRLSDIIHTPNFLGFTVQDNGEIVGFIAGYSKVSFQGLTFYLAEFCVNNKIQGKGYGSRLLSFLEQELQKRKIHSLFLITERNGIARKFYGGKGYSVNEDRIIMRKTF
ncbi:GNAT family N-acetyltransferase [Sporolactobacillus laevolacticus]|uniref:GNAT family N-acetyltransferase n=1 Tax=Sporolactobacillus laevolacticus TaxID=33018 RepID=UPI0025B51FF5|nr:GNAT family N-acetyltransferase [Sporolactobacillus laevolacticus]MDN3955201.1 GNAT family N-acetyltransferase [Sporolactobacillus laevolacticus]